MWQHWGVSLCNQTLMLNVNKERSSFSLFRQGIIFCVTAWLISKYCSTILHNTAFLILNNFISYSGYKQMLQWYKRNLNPANLPKAHLNKNCNETRRKYVESENRRHTKQQLNNKTNSFIMHESNIKMCVSLQENKIFNRFSRLFLNLKCVEPMVRSGCLLLHTISYAADHQWSCGVILLDCGLVKKKRFKSVFDKKTWWTKPDIIINNKNSEYIFAAFLPVLNARNC